MNAKGVHIRPLVVRIMNTWSLHLLYRDVYIRPWLLMTKQRGIQRVALFTIQGQVHFEYFIPIKVCILLVIGTKEKYCLEK